MFLKVREYRFIVDLFPNNTGFDTIAKNLVFVLVGFIYRTTPPLAAIPSKCLQPFYCLIICTAQPKFVLPKYFRY